MSEVQKAQQRWVAMSPEDRSAGGPATMSVCADALVELQRRLTAVRYPVRNILTPCPDLAESISQLERRGPAIPIPLRHLWELVGGITLVDIPSYRHVDFWIDHGIRFADGKPSSETLPQYCDGVRVEAPVSSDWLEFQLEEFDEQRDRGEPLVLTIAPDGYHKDDISGGPPYELAPAEDPWMPIVQNFTWAGPQQPMTRPNGPLDLVSYLRTAVLECGGFPGLFGSSAFEPIRARLTQDLPVF